jgi:hypothetical protein
MELDEGSLKWMLMKTNKELKGENDKKVDNWWLFLMEFFLF